jgi:ribosomal protein S8
MTAKKTLLDKLTKVSENFTVNMYSNGYMVDVSGQNKNSDWKSVKILVATEEELLDLIKQITQLERTE